MRRRVLALLVGAAVARLWSRRHQRRLERWGGVVATGPGIEVEHVEGLKPLVLWIAFGNPPDRLVLTGTHDAHSAYDSYRRWREQLELDYKPIGSPVRVQYRSSDGVSRTVTCP